MAGSRPTADDVVVRRPRGRPREVGVDERVLAAAQELLASDGYHRMSLDQVASASGVSKPSLYRRWPTKADLAAAAVARLHQDQLSATHGDEPGDLRGQLILELQDLKQTYDRLNGMAMVGTLLAEERHHPELIEVWRRLVARPRRQRMAALLDGARASGENASGVDVVTAVRLMVGAYYAICTVGDEFEPDWAARVVDAVLAGFSR